MYEFSGDQSFHSAIAFHFHSLSGENYKFYVRGSHPLKRVQSVFCGTRLPYRLFFRNRIGINFTLKGHCMATDKYVGELEEVLRYSMPKGRVGGFFAESIQGVGGTVQFPKGYLKKAFELIRNSGGLCISDEVQTGFGRTGEHFWGFQMHDVIPDIVTMAKGIGNGYPMAAVATTPEIAATLSNAIHFNTFGGNPVASAVGSAVLDVLEEDQCQAKSLEVGTYFLHELTKLRDEFPKVIGDVRGKGLMIGVELVADPETRTPLPPADVVEIWEACKDMGVLIGKGGFFGNVFRIKPPMCITKQDVDFTTAVMRKALTLNGH